MVSQQLQWRAGLRATALSYTRLSWDNRNTDEHESNEKQKTRDNRESTDNQCAASSFSPFVDRSGGWWSITQPINQTCRCVTVRSSPWQSFSVPSRIAIAVRSARKVAWSHHQAFMFTKLSQYNCKCIPPTKLLIHSTFHRCWPCGRDLIGAGSGFCRQKQKEIRAEQVLSWKAFTDDHWPGTRQGQTLPRQPRCHL